MLGHGDEVDVVLDPNRAGQQRLETGDEAGFLPVVQMVGVAELVSVGVVGAGGADDDGRKLVRRDSRRLGGGANGCDGPPESDLPGVDVIREVQVSDGGADDVHDAHVDLGGRHVQRGRVAGARIESVQLRGASAGAGGADTGIHDQSALFESDEELGGGRLREPRQPTHVAAAERGVLDEEVQHDAVVERPQEARCRRRRRGGRLPAARRGIAGMG